MKGNLRSTSFRHFALSYILFAAVLIAAMCIYLYTDLTRTVEAEFLSSGKTVLNHAVSAHRQQLEMMQNTVDEFIASSDFSPFLLRNDPLRSRNVIKRLHELTSVNQYYDSLILFFQNDDFLYTNSTSMEVERFLSMGLLYEHIPPEELRSLLYSDERFQMLISQNARGILSPKQDCVTYAFTLPNRRNTKVLFLVNTRKLQNLFTADESIYALLSDDDMIYASSPMLSDELALALQAGEERLDLDGEEYAVFAEHDSTFGLTTCVLRPIGQLRQSLIQKMWKLLIFAVLLSIPAALLVALFSSRFSRRIRKIQNILLPDEDMDDSLDLLETSALAVMQRSHQMKRAVEENVHFKRSQLVKQAVRGAFDDAQTLREAAQQVELDFSGSCFCVMLTNAFKDDSMAEIPLDDKEFASSVWGVWLTAYNQVLYLLSAENDHQMAEKQLLLENHLRCRHENSVVAVSSTKQNPSAIPTAFLEAQSAFDNRFLVNTNQLLRFEEVSQNTTLTACPDAWLDMLKSAIRLQSEVQVGEALDNILNHAKSGGMSMLSFRLMYNEMIQILLQEYANTNVQQDMLQMYSVFSLSHCLSVQELNDMLRDICLLLIRGKASDVNSSERMRSIALYIQNHYQDPDISMSVVAEKHEISSVAFSLRFKETFGMSPSDYLLMVRMQHAQKMLANTDLPVKEIGQAVGYGDFPNFLRRFKAYTAMTPSQYRQASRVENTREADET